MDKISAIARAIHQLQVAFEEAGLKEPSIQLNGVDDPFRLAALSTSILAAQHAGAENRINGMEILMPRR